MALLQGHLGAMKLEDVVAWPTSAEEPVEQKRDLGAFRGHFQLLLWSTNL
jgi:hypothetical protein